MSKELVGNLRWKKGYRMWKKVLDTWKEYRNIVKDMQGCNKEDLRQDREQQERLLYVNSKRKKDYRKPGPTAE